MASAAAEHPAGLSPDCLQVIERRVFLSPEKCQITGMSRRSERAPCPFDPRERDLIRREFGVHFGQPSHLADGMLLRAWRSGPDKGQPKVPPAVQSMLARGVLEVRQTPRGFRAYFTDAGLAAMRMLLLSPRLMDPIAFAHLREELGLSHVAEQPPD